MPGIVLSVLGIAVTHIQLILCSSDLKIKYFGRASEYLVRASIRMNVVGVKQGEKSTLGPRPFSYHKHIRFMSYWFFPAYQLLPALTIALEGDILHLDSEYMSLGKGCHFYSQTQLFVSPFLAIWISYFANQEVAGFFLAKRYQN